MALSKPARDYCATMNYGVDDEAVIEARQASVESLHLQPNVQYVVAGRETGPSGTLHDQIYAQFKKAVRASCVRKLLPSAHIESRKGSRDQAAAYCKKDGNYREWGCPGAQGQRNDLIGMKRLLDEGADMLTVADQHFGSFLRYNRGMFRYRMLKFKNLRRKRTVHWYWGPTGTGKTYSCPSGDGVYWKSGQNKWFPGYDCEKVVVFDDFRKNWWTFSYMLRLLDDYPLTVEVKGSDVPFLAEEIFITSPFHPKDVYATNECLSQLLRRIDEVKRFGVADHLFPRSESPCSIMDTPDLDDMMF